MNRAKPFRVLYLASQLPKRSETFVYREVLGLRRRGVDVPIASVHASERDLGDEQVDALANEATQLYPPGKWRLLRDAALSLLRGRGWRALACGLSDAVFARDVALGKRPKVIWQCLAGLALARRVRSKRVHHLHAHMAHVPATIGMYAAMALGVPFSFTGHAADLFRDRCLLKTKLRRARRVMCISRWHRRFYQSVLPVEDDRLPVVRCAVDLPPPRTAPPSADVLSVGRLVPKKGFDVLVRSIAALRSAGIAVRCTIVGDGPQRDALARLVAELNVTDCVHLIGEQSNRKVRQLMQEYGIFALPCRIGKDQDRDGIPVVLMEAMAGGAAVISGDLPTIRELISHDVNGLLVPSDDVNSLAAALKMLLADSNKRQQLGEAGRRTIRQEFDLDLNLQRLEDAFNSTPSEQPALCSTERDLHQEATHARPQLLPDQPVSR